MSFSFLKTSVDVIAPTCNRCCILWRAIQSVLSQDFLFFHLIIVDDRSIDQTKQLINFFHDPRIECYSTLHGESSAARTALVDWDFAMRLARSYAGKLLPVHKTLVNYMRKIGRPDSISANMNGIVLARAIYAKHRHSFKTRPAWITKRLSYV